MTVPSEPLRGDAAWRAAKKSVADRNEEAFKRARGERATRDEEVRARERAADRRERSELPHQPT